MVKYHLSGFSHSDNKLPVDKAVQSPEKLTQKVAELDFMIGTMYANQNTIAKNS
jgi:hypothetical protein